MYGLRSFYIALMSDILIKFIIRIWDLVLNTAQLLLTLLIKKILNFNHSFYPFEKPDISCFLPSLFQIFKIRFSKWTFTQREATWYSVMNQFFYQLKFILYDIVDISQIFALLLKTNNASVEKDIKMNYLGLNSVIEKVTNSSYGSPTQSRRGEKVTIHGTKSCGDQPK